MKQENSAPLERFFDLPTLSQAGAEIAIAASGDDLAQLAKWIDVDAVEHFDAVVKLKKLSQTRFAYSAEFKADVVQACVVTLEPVKAHIERQFARELHLASAKAARFDAPPDFAGALPVSAEETPEEITNPRFDVAGPLLEELVLSIDPYPRCEGAAFAEPGTPADKPENPFAVLKTLAKRG
jgi:uncharacterized metal-binding protein YceD (DUF177 family)